MLSDYTDINQWNNWVGRALSRSQRTLGKDARNPEIKELHVARRGNYVVTGSQALWSSIFKIMFFEKAGEYLVSSDRKNFPERGSVNQRERRFREEKGKGIWLQENRKKAFTKRVTFCKKKKKKSEVLRSNCQWASPGHQKRFRWSHGPIKALLNL